MKRDSRGNGTTTLAHVISQYRGIYHRIAQDAGVDPSYVSRIARQERSNQHIETALAKEVQRLHKLSSRWLGRSSD